MSDPHTPAAGGHAPTSHRSRRIRRTRWLGAAAALGGLACVDVPPRSDPAPEPVADVRPAGPDRALPDGAPADDAGLDARPADGMPPDSERPDSERLDSAPPVDAATDRGDADAELPTCDGDEIPVPGLGVCLLFTELDELPAIRLDHQMARDPSGALVVVGGPDLVNPVEGAIAPTYVLPPGAPWWNQATPPTYPRTRATLSAIPGLGLYLAGGDGAVGAVGALGSVERFEGDVVGWRETEQAIMPRSRHAAVLWRNGVLLIGGRDDNGPLDTTQLWPEEREGRPVPPLPDPREDPLAAALGDQIVVIGGTVGGMPVTDPIIWRGADAERWQDLPEDEGPLPLTTGAALGSDGRALVLAGGDLGTGFASNQVFVFTEADGWGETQPMTNRRRNHTITAIGDGLFAIIGSSRVVEIVRADPPGLFPVEPPPGFASRREQHAAAAGERSVTISGGLAEGAARDDVWRISQRPAD